MQLIYTPTINNSTINSAEIFKIQLASLDPIETISNIQFVFSPIETLTEYHTKELRFSIDGINYSSWVTLPIDLTILSNILNQNLNYVFFEFRFTRISTTPVQIYLTSLQIDYTLQTIPPNVCPIPAVNPCVFPTEEIGRCSKEYNNCAGVTLQCDSELFRINDYAGAMACLYEKVAEAAAQTISWNVYYFQVKPVEKSRDVILHEYTLHNVVAAKMLPIIVPDNEFPSNEISYSSFDMGFSEDFEIIIMKSAFENAFGISERPGLRDYLYFPIQNRIWEVHGSFLSKEDFMQFPIQYKVKLYKWQDKKNVARDSATDAIVDSIATNFDELFGDEVLEESDRVTHPQQYKLITIGDGDHIRKSIHSDLYISSVEIENYFTKISKNVYELNSVLPIGTTAIEYRQICDIDTTKNLSVSCWFKSVKNNFANNTNLFDTILFSKNVNGITFRANYGITPNNQIVSFSVELNNTTYLFDNLPTLLQNQWYGLFLNISNIHGTIDFKIWKIIYDPNNPTPLTKTTKLALQYSKSILYSATNFASGETFKILSGTFELTNLRLWKQPVGEESQSLILNQYIVKDSHNLILADNAMKPFILGTFKNR
jgi:hypothetical protein